MENIKVFVVRNNDGGFADYVQVPVGTTIGEFFRQQVDGGNEEDFLIRVNRETQPRNYELRANDRVSITPKKIEGAN